MQLNLFDYIREEEEKIQQKREGEQLELFLYLFNLLEEFIILESPIYKDSFTLQEQFTIYDLLAYLDGILKIGKYKYYDKHYSCVRKIELDNYQE